MKYTRSARLFVILMMVVFVFAGCAPLRRLFRMDRRAKDDPSARVIEIPDDSFLPPDTPIDIGEIPTEDELRPVRPGHPGEESILEVVYFAFDSSELLPEAKEALKRNAQWLLENPDVRVIVEGHCDERGTEQYNIGLGERRAKSVMHYLMLLGVEEGRLEIISYGESRPVDPRPIEEAWAKNRRVEFKRIP